MALNIERTKHHREKPHAVPPTVTVRRNCAPSIPKNSKAFSKSAASAQAPSMLRPPQPQAGRKLVALLISTQARACASLSISIAAATSWMLLSNNTTSPTSRPTACARLVTLITWALTGLPVGLADCSRPVALIISARLAPKMASRWVCMVIIPTPLLPSKCF